MKNSLRLFLGKMRLLECLIDMLFTFIKIKYRLYNHNSRKKFIVLLQ